MNVEHILVARRLKLEPFGPGPDPAPGSQITVALESGTPYRHYMAWAKAFATTIDVDIQPRFGGQDDGAVVNITTNPPIQVFKVPIEEIRPPTRLTKPQNGNVLLPTILKSELIVTNKVADKPATVDVFMMAAATPGGA